MVKHVFLRWLILWFATKSVLRISRICKFFGKCVLNSQKLENTNFFHKHISGTTQRSKMCFTIMKFTYSQLKNETLWIKIGWEITSKFDENPSSLFFATPCRSELKVAKITGKKAPPFQSSLLHWQNGWIFVNILGWPSLHCCTVKLQPKPFATFWTENTSNLQYILSFVAAGKGWNFTVELCLFLLHCSWQTKVYTGVVATDKGAMVRSCTTYKSVRAPPKIWKIESF